MGGVVNIITKTETASKGHGRSLGDLTYSIVARSMKMEDPEQTRTTCSAGTDTVEVPTSDGSTIYIRGYIRQESSSNALITGFTWDTRRRVSNCPERCTTHSMLPIGRATTSVQEGPSCSRQQ